uniref:Uncharacterized protein n=1 Tax=Klebsiella pneumoniae TaxID=573 RepID=A0A8B0SRE8_KLEPN|nr:hypothetical protein [Klebsiella pneumoniae]
MNINKKTRTTVNQKCRFFLYNSIGYSAVDPFWFFYGLDLGSYWDQLLVIGCG